STAPWPTSNSCCRPPGSNTSRSSPPSKTSSSRSSATLAKTTGPETTGPATPMRAAETTRPGRTRGKEQTIATHFFGDTAVLTGRTLRHVTRSLDTIITTAVTPIGIMLLFVYVFGGAINTGSVSYVNYMLPGILLITIASGISYTAFRLFTDVRGGI